MLPCPSLVQRPESDRCVALLRMCCRFVMHAHKSLCHFWQMQLVAEYDYRARKELHLLRTEPVSMSGVWYSGVALTLPAM